MVPLASKDLHLDPPIDGCSPKGIIYDRPKPTKTIIKTECLTSEDIVFPIAICFLKHNKPKQRNKNPDVEN